MKLNRLCILLTFIVFFSCNSDRTKDYRLSVKHYGGGAGITIIYSINNTRLKVDTNCDLADCKEATVYKRSFSKTQSDSIISILNSLRLDTLKRSYDFKGYFDDGFFTEIELKKGLFSSTKSSFNNVYTPTAEKLNAFIDSLVTKPEFRLATWGETQ